MAFQLVLLLAFRIHESGASFLHSALHFSFNENGYCCSFEQEKNDVLYFLLFF